MNGLGAALMQFYRETDLVHSPPSD